MANKLTRMFLNLGIFEPQRSYKQESMHNSPDSSPYAYEGNRIYINGKSNATIPQFPIQR